MEFKCPDGEVMKKEHDVHQDLCLPLQLPGDNDIFESLYYRKMYGDMASKARDSETCEHFRLSLESIHISFLCTHDFSGTKLSKSVLLTGEKKNSHQIQSTVPCDIQTNSPSTPDTGLKSET